jgi:hypothetical protein
MSSVAVAQVAQTGIHGTVKDASSAVVPQAILELTDPSTNVVRKTTAGGDGSFVFVNLQDGSYKLTATKAGFASSITDSIVVDAGRITDVTVVLKVGATTETVEVAGSGVQLETTSNEVGTTVSTKEINALPYASRDALSFALLTPGVQAASGGDTFNGLPNASMNISLDGMNNNSQRFKSGGTSFYAFAPERLDAVDEMTVSTSGLGADASGQGAMQIRFTTKRGTDRYHFHVLEQFGNEDLNSNSWFNNAEGIRRPKSRPANYAGNFGGPLLPFSSYFKNKLFFFLNFEDQPQPSSAVINNTVLTSDMYNGNITYLGTDGQNHTVNVLTVAGAAGYPTALNSTTGAYISAIRATQSNPAVFQYLPISGVPYEQTMQWNTPLNLQTKYPTGRLDYQITSKVAYHTTWNMRNQVYTGYPEWPGAPVPDLYPGAETYKISTYVWTHAIDATITPHLVNNFTFGIQTNLEYFFDPADPHQWAPYGNVYVSLGLLTPLISSSLPTDRNNPVYQASDTLTWVKGKHTLLFGGSILHTSFYEYDYNSAGVPHISTGVTSTDPIGNILQAAMPALNLNGSDAANAKSLYAMLTGRISAYSTSFNVDEKSHQYAQFAPELQRMAHTTGGIYVADTWRIRPNLTLNWGFRWELDGAIRSTNGIDTEASSLFGPSQKQFAPGQLGGDMTPSFSVTNSMYRGDYINPAPSAGISWSPHSESGILSRFLGHDKTVLGIAYRMTYYDEGMNAISNLMGENPGPTQSVSGSAAIAANPGTFFVGGNTPAVTTTPASFNFPLPLGNYVLNGGVSSYSANPNLKTPYVQDWNIHYQREIGRGSVLSISYIGNKATHVWHYQNVQEVNILENGFLSEFKNAQSNLAIANGMTVAQLTSLPTPSLKVANFSNTGLAGQVSLPIFQTAFGPNGSNAALSASNGFANTSFITALQQSAVYTVSSALASTTTATYACRLLGSNFAPCAAQGYTQSTAYPINFFVANPYAASLGYQNDDANSNYNGLQIHYRHAATHGITMDASYVFSHTLGTIMDSSDQQSTTTWYTMRNGHLNYGPTPFDHRNTFIIYGLYQLPFGRGKYFNITNPVMNKILGDWTAGSSNQITSGGWSTISGGRLPFNGTATDGVVFGNGLNLQQLVQDTATQTTGYVASCTCIKTNVSNIIQANGSANPAYYAPSQVAGQWATPLYYVGKTAFVFNLSLQKEFQIKERFRLGFYAEATNFLNHPFFSQGSTSTTATTFGYITSASGARTVLLRGFLNF